MKNKICLVTGATSGIGGATALELARLGATVICAGRNRTKCARSVERIRHSTGNSSVDFLVADLSSQAEIHHLAEEIRGRYERLDVLVNNAGGYFRFRQLTVDGLETTFALNHLAYFLLTLLLLERLQASSSSRIVIISSTDHESARIEFDDLMGERRYDRRVAYAQSKLSNILFTYELARRLRGSAPSVNALCPGAVRTNLGANNGWLRKKVANLLDTKRVSPEEGARTPIYLATSPEVSGVSGRFFRAQKEVRSSDVSYDRRTAERLWEVSEQLTGFVFPK
jgi:NAD(P)-dependent dehydrogenase (short-subunit alcohol dehydrogenase family)